MRKLRLAQVEQRHFPFHLSLQIHCVLYIWSSSCTGISCPSRIHQFGEFFFKCSAGWFSSKRFLSLSKLVRAHKLQQHSSPFLSLSPSTYRIYYSPPSFLVINVSVAAFVEFVFYSQIQILRNHGMTTKISRNWSQKFAVVVVDDDGLSSFGPFLSVLQCAVSLYSNICSKRKYFESESLSQNLENYTT